MQIVGCIVKEILAAQEEDRIVKWVKQIGKQFVAKAAIESSLVAMGNTVFTYGDHHPEATWYDYEEEIEEPKPPYERNLAIKVIKRQTLDIDLLDTDIDVESSLKLSGSKQRLKSPMKGRLAYLNQARGSSTTRKSRSSIRGETLQPSELDAMSFVLK